MERPAWVNEPVERKRIERLAPKVAASDTPKVEGDAISFLRLLCIIAPEAVKPAPAIRAANTRLRRMLPTMTLACPLPKPNMPRNISPRSIPWVCASNERIMASNMAKANAMIRMKRFLAIFRLFPFMSIIAVSLFTGILIPMSQLQVQ